MPILFFCTKLRHLFFHIINTKYILRCIIKQVHCTNLRDFYYTCPTGAHSTNTSTSGSIHWTIYLKNSLISNSYLKVDPLIIETEIRIEDSMRQIMFSFEKFTYTVTLNIYTLTIFKAIKFLSEEWTSALSHKKIHKNIKPDRFVSNEFYLILLLWSLIKIRQHRKRVFTVKYSNNSIV